LKLLRPLSQAYDYVFLDCPPSISLVSENIFRAADGLLLPLIPTTLSLRTYEQLLDFLEGHRIQGLELLPFFSMVDRRKRMHLEVMESLPDSRRELLQTQIPYASDVEKMGIHRMPVGEFAPNSPAWKAYLALWSEVQARLGVR
jgi:cellulose biosynthesis protein BcsQ